MKDNLASAKQEIRELKKAKKILENIIKKLENCKKASQQRLEDVEQSSLEKRYDEELQRNVVS